MRAPMLVPLGMVEVANNGFGTDMPTSDMIYRYAVVF